MLAYIYISNPLKTKFLWFNYVDQIESHSEETMDQKIICSIRFDKISFYKDINLTI